MILTVFQLLCIWGVDIFCDGSWTEGWTVALDLLRGLFVHIRNVIFNAPEFKFSTPSVLPLLLFSSSRLTCFSTLRMTKVNVLVLKKSETNCWISMRIWWLTVVNSLFWYNLCCCVKYLGQWQLWRSWLWLSLLGHNLSLREVRARTQVRTWKRLQKWYLLTCSGLCL